MAKATKLGGVLRFGPMTTPFGRFAALSDPQGANFSVIDTTTTEGEMPQAHRRVLGTRPSAARAARRGHGMIEHMRERVVAACDGASKGNPGPAGWAWVVADATETPGPLGGGAARQGHQQRRGTHRAGTPADGDRPGVPLEIRMDSQYAMKAVTTWLPGWKRNGWKTSAGKPVANQDLVVRIDELLDGRTVEFRYVPAHQVDGDPLNDFADRAASQAATVQEPAGSGLGSPEPPPSPDTPAKAPRSRAARRRRPREERRKPPRAPSRRSSPAAACAAARYAAGESIAKNAQRLGPPGVPYGPDGLTDGSGVAQAASNV